MRKNMKKSIILLFVISISLSIFNCYYVYAEEKKNIVKVNNTETIGNDIKITINLDDITYNNFKFNLSSSESLKDITLDLNDYEVISNNEISFDISKEQINLSIITLNYKVPSTVSVGDKIEFNIQIINNDNEEEITTLKEEVTIIDKVEEIKEETKTDTEKDNKEVQQDNKNVPTQTKQQTNNIVSIKQVSSNFSVTKATTTPVVSSTPKVTYNGSDNNYLSKLVIKNYDLNKDFTKENSNYFLTVNNDVTKITVTAKAEDSNSKVSINGNDNLEVGVNKVLITVTAENENTRNYRIYVTRKSE